MPLVVMTGIPCSGKTTRSLQVKEYLEQEHGKKVQIVSELEAVSKAGYDRNTFYSDSRKEKSVRSDVKSHVQRLLNTTDVLILDGSNYIKGYRYEIYCMTKLFKTPLCTIQCDLPVEHAWLWNEKRAPDDRYSREIFDALVNRYEPPDSRNRWDSPLFVVFPEDNLKLEDIHKALYDVAAPKPNQSTQCPRLSSTNYLYELDRITQEIVNAVISAKQMGIESDIKIPGCDVPLQRGGETGRLTRLRRQFLTYSKMKQSDPREIPLLFVRYLNESL